MTWLLEPGGDTALHRMLPRRAEPTTEAVTCIGFAEEGGHRVFTGQLRGRVLPEPRDVHSFGFDPIFVPDGEERTLAEMRKEEKDALSPRGAALSAFAAFLDASTYRRGVGHGRV